MSFLEKKKFKKIMTVTIWSLLGFCGLVLLVAALNRKEEKTCTGVEVQINGISNNFFVSKEDIIELVKHNTGPVIKGRLLKEFNLDTLEMQIEKDVWINKAELYFDKNGKLQVEIEEKNPVARVFCTDGSSFYLDTELKMLPLSSRHAARLPAFTGFPTSLKVLSKMDSMLLDDVRQMSVKIQQDDFLMAMIDQVDINAQRQFEFIPKIGEQIIFFGNATDMDLKFRKMKLFYKKIIPEYGWSKYSKVNLDYKGQIVTTLKGSMDVTADSMKTIQMMKVLAEYTALKAADTTQTIIPDNSNNSTDPALINKSIQRDDIEITPAETGNIIAPAPAVIVKPEVKTITPKPEVKKAADVKKPVQVVMPKKTPTKTDKPKAATNKPMAPVQSKPASPKVNNDY